jgi:hypothetical protein
MPLYKPIGGDSDGQMGRKLETVWESLLQRFMPENDRLQARTTSAGLQMKSEFSVKGLQQKFFFMYGKYKELFLSTARSCNRALNTSATVARAEHDRATSRKGNTKLSERPRDEDGPRVARPASLHRLVSHVPEQRTSFRVPREARRT